MLRQFRASIVVVVLTVPTVTVVLVVMGHKTAPGAPTCTQVVGRAQDWVREAVMDMSQHLIPARPVKLSLAAAAAVTEAEVVALLR